VRAQLRAQQLVQLDLDRLGVAVLRCLDEEHHEEGDDGGERVDHELPGVAEAEERARERPCDDEDHDQEEGAGPADEARCPLGDPGEEGRFVAHSCGPRSATMCSHAFSVAGRAAHSS
jgi:hypothetical protein